MAVPQISDSAPLGQADTALERHSYLGFITTESGETYTLQQAGIKPADDVIESGGLIFTEHDMPTLEAILEQHRVLVAVLERPAPDVSLRVPDGTAPRAVAEATRPRYVRSSSPGRIAAAAAIAGASLALGVFSVVAAITSDGIKVGGDLALAALVAGVGLIATVIVAVAAEPHNGGRPG